ncbi:GGDEF and EAL domain-containing protein [uncultured Roseobacter sp.]|uniref:putative bifunctional diguanylate cyclase/phosphodiesterase n=1 Tax=uncultured Roseobacter sp. TaxID=114847 RepID=UPI00261206C7|nr:GGDEF and EAL domain-containing protein [uncultured Roseobacter sp.]
MHARTTGQAQVFGPLVEAIGTPAFVLDADNDIVAANPAAWGLLPVGATKVADILPDHARARTLEHLTRVRAGKSAIDCALLPTGPDPSGAEFVATALMGAPEVSGFFLCQLAQPVDYRPMTILPLPGNIPKRAWDMEAGSGTCIAVHEPRTLVLSEEPESIQSLLMLVDPADVRGVTHALAKLLSGTDDRMQALCRIKDGGTDLTILMEGTVSARDPDGFPTTIAVMESDVTVLLDRHVGAASVAPDAGRWKAATINANQGVWHHDFEKGTYFFSETWRRQRGLSADERAVDMVDNWLATVHPNDRAHAQEEKRRVDRGETNLINQKYRQRHRDGRWIWFMSRGRVLRRNSDGYPVEVIGTDTDINDIKVMELESQRMAERLDVAMEAAGMARWEYKINADEAFWDDRLLNIFGITDGRNIRPGSDWMNYIHPDDRAEAFAYTQDCTERGADVAFDYRCMTPDGEVRYIRTRGKYVRDSATGPRYYGINFDITEDKMRAQELEEARAMLEHESRHDALTGLANRRRLDDVYSELLNTGLDAGTRVAVMHFDIDQFKQINDTMGHDAGDETLKHAASILRSHAPDGALVSRIGGDEFAALVFDAPDDAALTETAERIIRHMSQPFHYYAHECNIGTSIGIAVAEGQPDPESNLFIDADLALYEAKKAGRGRVRFFNGAMKEAAQQRKNSFDALLAGFEQGEITCHYQPQFDTKTLELTGLEALVRWESDRFGLLMPGEFLQTAEDMGLLAQFDELVLRRALHDMQSWEAAGLAVPQISVNVSSHRLNDPSLGDQLRALELPARKLSFELLESAFLDARNDVIDRNLRMINQMGIDIEIDDFGSGHASIASLLEILPKRLKIDRSLIQPIVGSEQQRALVETIIGIGEMLDIRVVAEGVETTEHVHLLQKMNCCYLQGYGLARPMDATAMRSFLEDLSSSAGRLRLA